MGVGKLHVLHVANKIALGGCSAEPRIEGELLGNCGDVAAGVVVAGIEQAGPGQGVDLLGDRCPKRVGIALLEVTAATAPHQQGVPGEGH